MSEADVLKQRAAARAAELIEDGMVLGLGTGSTAGYALRAIAERRERQELRKIVGVPTSNRTRALAEDLGIPLTTLETHPHLDLTIDGADEIDARLDLIKGLGGALLREKIVAAASDRLVIVADDSKRVPRLGTRSPLPIEVVPFGWTTHLDFLTQLGADALPRRTDSDALFTTDGGHFLLDCTFSDGISDADALERTLVSRPGVVESGLFLGMAEMTIVASEDGVDVTERDGPRTR